MGREVWRMDFKFNHLLGVIWWGYQLPPIACQSCHRDDGDCAVCEGEGQIWPKVEPPGYKAKQYPYANIPTIDKGYGWQMWEDTSEGSPMSPVCKSPEALAQWLVDNKASAAGSMTATYEQWLGTIHAGSAFSSMTSAEGGLESGVAVVGRSEKGGDENETSSSHKS